MCERLLWGLWVYKDNKAQEAISFYLSVNLASLGAFILSFFVFSGIEMTGYGCVMSKEVERASFLILVQCVWVLF